MKTKINYYDYPFDPEQFVVKEGLFCGIAARLIHPNDITVKFTQQNKIFRSSIWDLEGNLLSASFPKFTNWGENPDNFPLPKSLSDTNTLTKVDGSTMIVDYVNHFPNVRTRGVFNVGSHDNSKDFDFVLKKYPSVIDFSKEYPQFSLLFEIVSPNRKIILDYGPEPDIYLIGAIYKDDYTLATQSLLDIFAAEMGVKRPKYFKFPTIEELISSVEKNNEIEGVVVYSNSDQTLHKCKTVHYLALHRLKSELSSFNKVVDIYLNQGKPIYEDFYSTILKTFDFELAELCKDNLKKCCELGEIAKKTIKEIEVFVSNFPSDLSRKDKALVIINKYDEKLRSIAFTFMNSQKLEDKMFKRLIVSN